MSELQNSPPPKKRSGLAWFLGGAGLVVLLLLLLCCGGVGTAVYFVYQQATGAKQFLINIQTTEPVKYAGTKISQPEIDAAFNRCVDAMEEVRQGKTATLTLTDVELNNLHEERVANGDAALPGMDIVARAGGIKGRVSVPNPDGSGYLTMDIDLDLAILNNQLTFNIDSLTDLKGETAPFAVREMAEIALREGLLYGEGNQAPANARTGSIEPTSPLYGLKSLSFEPGKINMEVDPERVKEHNKATGKPEDSALFGDK